MLAHYQNVATFAENFGAMNVCNPQLRDCSTNKFLYIRFYGY